MSLHGLDVDEYLFQQHTYTFAPQIEGKLLGIGALKQICPSNYEIYLNPNLICLMIHSPYTGNYTYTIVQFLTKETRNFT